MHTREPRHRFVIHLHDAFQGDRELLNTFRRGTIEPPESRSPEDVPLRGRRIGGEDLLERSLCLIFWIFREEYIWLVFDGRCFILLYNRVSCTLN